MLIDNSFNPSNILETKIATSISSEAQKIFQCANGTKGSSSKRENMQKLNKKKTMFISFDTDRQTDNAINRLSNKYVIGIFFRKFICLSSKAAEKITFSP